MRINMIYLGDKMLQILLIATLASTVIGMINEADKQDGVKRDRLYKNQFQCKNIFCIILNYYNNPENNYLKEIQFRQQRRKLDDGKFYLFREVPNSIKQYHASRVKVRIVTGDNILNAIAIAKECRIFPTNRELDEWEIVERKQFREFVGGLKDEATIRKTVKFVVHRDVKVMASVSPEDKYNTCSQFIAEENFIAVTGHGTNDAPALKKADVGFAMDITRFLILQISSYQTIILVQSLLR